MSTKTTINNLMLKGRTVALNHSTVDSPIFFTFIFALDRAHVICARYV